MSVTKLNLNNKLINGSFDFWQRGTSFVSPGNSVYTADRWANGKNGTWNATVSRSSDVPASAFGQFSYLFTVTTAQASLTGIDTAGIQQRIEGNVLQTFKGKKIALSFWVKSSIIGTFHISCLNGAANRSIVKRYTVSQANTWEKKTIRLTHDEAGTWDYTSGIGMYLWFSLAEGPTRSSPTVDNWQNAYYLSATGQTNLVATISNTFRIADVCLVEDNEGQTRSPDFVYAGRDYSEELQLCQRYFEKSYDLNEAPGTINGTNGCCFGVAGTNLLHAKRVVAVQYKVRKRVAGVAYPWGPYSGVIDRFGVQATGTDSAANQGGGSESHANFVKNGTLAVGEGDGILFNWTCDAEL